MKNFLIAISLLAAPAAAPAADAPAAPKQLACVYEMTGAVEIGAAGGAGWRPAAKGAPLSEGESLRTGRNGTCDLLFKDGSFVKIDENSEAAVEKLAADAGGRVLSFAFLRGKALWMAAKIKNIAASKFSVRTPSAVCAVRGTDFSIAVSSGGDTAVGLFDGEVSVSGAQGEKTLLAGKEASAGAAGVEIKEKLSPLMKAEERRYGRVKARVESLRKRLAERDDFIDDYISRQQKKLDDFDKRRQEKLKRR
jgi:hypothetical protein